MCKKIPRSKQPPLNKDFLNILQTKSFYMKTFCAKIKLLNKLREKMMRVRSMKRIVIVLLIILGIHVTLSRAKPGGNNTFSVYTKNGTPIKITLSKEEKAELLGLVKIYKRHFNEYCSLDEMGITPNYISRTPQEFKQKMKTCSQKIENSLDRIKKFYIKVTKKIRGVDALVDSEKNNFSIQIEKLESAD